MALSLNIQVCVIDCQDWRVRKGALLPDGLGDVLGIAARTAAHPSSNTPSCIVSTRVQAPLTSGSWVTRTIVCRLSAL